MKTILLKIAWNGAPFESVEFIPWTGNEGSTAEEIELVAIGQAIRQRGGRAAIQEGKSLRLETWRHDPDTDLKWPNGKPMRVNNTVYLLSR